VKDASARPVHGPSTAAPARNSRTPVAGAIPFVDNDATLSLAAGTLLTDFTREVNKQIPESHPIPLYLKGCANAYESGVFAYNVAVHEFGHMLGLPDEYENPWLG
jgi:hypothetical protein